MIEIVQDNDVSDFLARVSSVLYDKEAEYSLMLGLCEGMAKTKPASSPILIAVKKNNRTIAAAIQTPPMNLVISLMEQEELVELARYLKKMDASFPGVVGPAKTSELFAKIWSELMNQQVQLGMGQKIYKLEKVIEPKSDGGDFRPANQNDFKIVMDWIIAFAKESLPPSDQRGEEHWKSFAERAVSNQTAHLWLVNNRAVSIAFCSRPTKNGISINGVYTPPSERKKGYASAVVAKLSQKMLDSGKQFCVLYTDLSNPTSNKIYQNIGYHEVADSKHFIFTPLS